jgi:hypothetical protein
MPSLNNYAGCPGTGTYIASAISDQSGRPQWRPCCQRPRREGEIWGVNRPTSDLPETRPLDRLMCVLKGQSVMTRMRGGVMTVGAVDTYVSELSDAGSDKTESDLNLNTTVRVVVRQSD